MNSKLKYEKNLLLNCCCNWQVSAATAPATANLKDLKP